MATLALIATGNLSGACANQISGGSAAIHATSNTTVATGADTFSATFTGPNLVNTCLGTLFYLASKGFSTSVTITLQEDLLGTATWLDTVATVTISASDLVSAVTSNSGYGFAAFGTPYTYATTGAGRYRFKYRAAGASITFSQAGTGGTIWFQAVDSRTATPGATDQCYILGQNGTLTPTAITIDASTSVFLGSNVTLSTPATARVDNCGCYIGMGGTLVSSTVASATLTYNGPIICDGEGGIVQDMSSASSYNSIFQIQAVSTQTQGIFICANGKDTFKGIEFTQKVSYVSGTGTAADPIVLGSAPTGWALNKEICITATGNGATNYNESEKRFIKSFPTSTTMVVSSTAGGVEAALTYTHTSAAEIVFADYSNVLRTSVDTKTWKYSNGAATTGYTNWQYCKTDLTGGNSLANGLIMRSGTNTVPKLTLNNVVFYRPGRGDPSFVGATDTVTQTYDAITCLYDTSGIAHTSGNGSPYIGQTNTIFTNLVSVNGQGTGVTLTGTCSGVILSSPLIVSNAIGSSGTIGLYVSGASNQVLTPKINATRGYGFGFSAAEDIYINGGGNGNNGINQSGNILCTATHNKVVFENVTHGSGTLISSYTSMLAGSEIAFQKHNATDNYHFWYSPFGKAELTGLTGCPDTTLAANGNPTLTITPESTSPGFTWKFQVLVRATSSAAILLKNLKNSTFGSDVVTLNLYLPGSTTPDKTVNAPNDTVENTLTLAASYVGTVPLLFDVEVIAKSVAAGAKTRISNIFNGTNDIINLKTWYRGKPASIMFEQLGDANAVWQVVASTANTAGTMGELQNYLALIFISALGQL